ncbi:MAG TPA: hypothetical protein DCY89_07050 [Gammaproteobacteria bacterium]|nr:hypothetical protein [Gammaproteobacteria bacterium]
MNPFTADGIAPPSPRWRLWLTRAYLFVCFASLMLILATQRASLASLKPETPWLLGVAAVLIALTHIFAVSFTRGLLHGLGVTVSRGLAAELHLRFLPARYLPGGIWHTVGRMEQLRRCGVSVSRSSILPLAESLVAILAAVSFSLLLLFMPLTTHAWITGSVALIVLALVLTHGDLTSNGLPFSHLLLTGTGFWASQQLAFGVFTLALAPGPLAPAHATGYWLFAWAIGHVTVFAPQGLGVSEFAFAQIAGGGVEAALLVTTFRVIQAAGDVLAWSAWLGLRAQSRL